MWKKIRRPRPLPRQGRRLGPPEVWNLALSSLATATMTSQLRKQSLWNVELGSPRCQDCKVQILSLLHSLFVCFQAKHGEERWQMGLCSRWGTVFSQTPQWSLMPVISSARAARTWIEVQGSESENGHRNSRLLMLNYVEPWKCSLGWNRMASGW